MKLKLIMSLFFLLPLLSFSQMRFKSVGSAKPLELTFGWQTRKGAFVWYKGQKEPISLKFKSLYIDSSERASGQPDFYSYKFTEMYNGKSTGEYGITEWPRNVDDIYYIRYKDGKKFKFNLIKDDETYDGKSMVLLHDVQFHYYTFYEDSLSIVYPNGSKTELVLNELQYEKHKVRRVKIKDYNFDGIDDIAFDITSSDGLHVVYDVFIYDPDTKKFTKLKEPANKGCGYMINLKLDPQSKTLVTMCKNGSKWISFTYRFNQLGKLILVSEE